MKTLLVLALSKLHDNKKNWTWPAIVEFEKSVYHSFFTIARQSVCKIGVILRIQLRLRRSEICEFEKLIKEREKKFG